MFGGLPGSKTKIGQSFPRGTTMPFFQAAAPIGWTKLTTQNDKALRVVSGSGGVSGGTNAFSTVMAQTVVGGHTLTTAECPVNLVTGSFATQIQTGGSMFSNGTGVALTTNSVAVAQNAGNGSHNHAITMDIQYIDLILAKKN